VLTAHDRVYAYTEISPKKKKIGSKKERRSPKNDCKPGSKKRSKKESTLYTEISKLGTSKKNGDHRKRIVKNPVVKTKIGSEYWFLEQSKRIHARVISKTDVRNGLF